MSLYSRARISGSVCLTPVVTGADSLQGVDISEDRSEYYTSTVAQPVNVLYLGYWNTIGPLFYDGPDLLESTRPSMNAMARDPLGIR